MVAYRVPFLDWYREFYRVDAVLETPFNRWKPEFLVLTMEEITPGLSLWE